MILSNNARESNKFYKRGFEGGLMKDKDYIKNIFLESFKEVTKFQNGKFNYPFFNRYFFILKLLQRFMREGFKGKSLDIGCGSGVLCMAMKKLGYSVYGVDVFNDHNKFAEMGINYKICNIEKDSLPFNDETFNIVTLIEVIEHFIYSPSKVLKEIYRVLNKKGILILTTPNVASLNNRVRLLKGKNIFWNLNDFLNENITVRHNREYTLKEIIILMKLTGFEIIKCGYFSARTFPQNLQSYIKNKIGWLRDIIPSFRKNIFVVCKKGSETKEEK